MIQKNGEGKGSNRQEKKKDKGTSYLAYHIPQRLQTLQATYRIHCDKPRCVDCGASSLCSTEVNKEILLKS